MPDLAGDNTMCQGAVSTDVIPLHLHGHAGNSSSALAGSQGPGGEVSVHRALLGSAANIANEVAERAEEMGVAGDPARTSILEQLISGSLTPDMSLMEHALQCAQLCRIFFGHMPEYEYMPLVGLISGLGKLLAHNQFGSQPQVSHMLLLYCRAHVASSCQSIGDYSFGSATVLAVTAVGYLWGILPSGVSF